MMEVIRKAVRRSPNIFKGKHKKLGEGWAENQDTVSDGITFYLKYLGSGLVEELLHGQSYSGLLSAQAVAGVIAMAKTAGRKLRKVSLCVSWKGLRVTDLVTNESVLDVSIYRVSFCTADRHHDKVFAFMCRNKVNETVECHAFLCAKRKIAQAVTLTVSQAFSLAKDLSDVSTKSRQHTSQPQASPVALHPGTAAQVSDGKSNPLLTSPIRVKSPANNEKKSVSQSSPTPQTAGSKWEVFDDVQMKRDDSEDDFLRLAEKRVRPTTPHLYTDLSPRDIDASVQLYQHNPQLCLQELDRTPSLDDLLHL